MKKAILHRKNSLFYETENGAAVGDLYMSLTHTAELNGVDPFDYLVQLQRHKLIRAFLAPDAAASRHAPRAKPRRSDPQFCMTFPRRGIQHLSAGFSGSPRLQVGRARRAPPGPPGA